MQELGEAFHITLDCAFVILIHNLVINYSLMEKNCSCAFNWRFLCSSAIYLVGLPDDLHVICFLFFSKNAWKKEKCVKKVKLRDKHVLCLFLFCKNAWKKVKRVKKSKNAWKDYFFDKKKVQLFFTIEKWKKVQLFCEDRIFFAKLAFSAVICDIRLHLHQFKTRLLACSCP
jgi:hypothetical protein